MRCVALQSTRTHALVLSARLPRHIKKVNGPLGGCSFQSMRLQGTRARRLKDTRDLIMYKNAILYKDSHKGKNVARKSGGEWGGFFCMDSWLAVS